MPPPINLYGAVSAALFTLRLVLRDNSGGKVPRSPPLRAAVHAVNLAKVKDAVNTPRLYFLTVLRALLGFFSRFYSPPSSCSTASSTFTSVLLSATVSPVSATSCIGSPRSDSSSLRVGGGMRLPTGRKCRAEGRVRRGSQPPRFSDGRLPSPVVTAAPADRSASPSALRLSPAVLTARCHATQITPYPLTRPLPQNVPRKARGNAPSR